MDMNDAIVVFAAGSLKRAFRELLGHFGETTGILARAEFGPAGLLRERLEQGEQADLFASADCASPARLVALGRATGLRVFARNELCAVVRLDSGIDKHGLLDAMMAPEHRLGMSTPVLDPSGDYALRVIRNADTLRPGAGRRLREKAVSLVGGRTPTEIPDGWVAGEYLVYSGATDIFLSYASYRQAILEAARVRVIALPDTLQVRAEYGMVIMTPRHGAVKALSDYLMGPSAQAILRHHGFLALV